MDLCNRFFLLFLFGVSVLFAKPKAIVFDFGNVMSRVESELVVDFLKNSFHLDDQEFQAFSKKIRERPNGLLDREFLISFAESKNIIFEDSWFDELKAKLVESIHKIDGMYELVKDLQDKGYQTALFSNVKMHHAAILREHGYYAPFDPVVLSYEIEKEKPDSVAYEILLKNLSHKPKDILFIDDKPENICAAREMGIDAIQFISYDDLISELKKRNIF